MTPSLFDAATRPQTPLESHWAERLETAVGALASATDALRRFDAGNPAGQSADAGAQSRRQSLQATLAERERDLHAALEAVRAAFTRYAESLPATPPTGPGIRTASALRGDLPAGTALLQIIALPDHLRLLLIDRNGEQTHRIAQDRLALNGRVTTFLDLLRHPRRDVVPQSRQLYDLLIGPVRSELDRRGVGEHLGRGIDGHERATVHRSRCRRGRAGQPAADERSAGRGHH